MNFVIKVYGLLCYLVFLATSLYAIGFVGNFIVPKSMDTALETSILHALVIDSILILIFGLQHSLMAREDFKNKLIKILPMQIERSTYVLCSSLALVLLFWQWRPIGGIVWDVSNTSIGNVFIAIGLLGWGILFVSTFLLDHFSLFGLRQIFTSGDKSAEVGALKTPALYKLVRHPIYFGFTLAFWFTPTMTYTHLLFAVGMLVYTLMGALLEERDLVKVFGEEYRKYQSNVSMLIPFFPRKSK